MAFQIDKTFVVRAPAPAVWDFLTDPRRVARCMPGAAITDQVDPTTYAGTITVKVGPMSASYRGRMTFAKLDPAARSAEIMATGQDIKGKGGASMKLTSHLVERAPSETEVLASSELNVTGMLAQLGRGMIQDVGDQIFQKFTDAMRAELEGEAGGPLASASEGAEGAAAGEPTAAGPLTPIAIAPPTVTLTPSEAATPASPPLDIAALGAGAAARAAGRSLRRPGFWIAVAVLVAIALWLSRR